MKGVPDVRKHVDKCQYTRQRIKLNYTDWRINRTYTAWRIMWEAMTITTMIIMATMPMVMLPVGVVVTTEVVAEDAT